MESMLRRAGLVPEMRQRYGDYNIFIADGISTPPHNNFRKFGLEPDEFPGGCYVTFWWIAKDETVYRGRPIYCDLFHDKSLSSASKKYARVNAALADAEGFLITSKKVALNG